MEDISLRIKELMAESNLTNTEFAKKIDINPSIISHIISGRNKVSLQVIEAIRASFTNVNIEYLLSGEGNLFKNVTNVKGDLHSSEPVGFSSAASAFPMEGVRHASIPGTAPSATSTDQAGTDEKQNEEAMVKEPKPYSLSRSADNQEVEKIVILYKDGTFKVYKPSAL